MKKQPTPENAAAAREGRNVRVYGQIEGAIERAADDGEMENAPKRYRASFSSEMEEKLWRGFSLVLLHGDGNVDLSLANEGASILYNHDRKHIIGKIHRAWIEKKRGMCEFSFAPTEAAAECQKLVDEGYLTRTSVGAVMEESTIEETDDGGEIRKATKWQVVEVSLVAVPADASVGIGRGKSLEVLAEGVRSPNDSDIKKESKAMSDPDKNKNPDDIRITREAADSQAKEAAASAEKLAIEREQSRVSEIDRACELATTLPLAEREKLAREARRDGTSYSDFMAALIKRTDELTKEDPSALNDPSKIGMSDKEVKRFSLSRALGNLVAPDKVSNESAAFELECLRATASRAQRGGIVLPYEILAARSDGFGEVRRLQQIGGATTGANLLETEYRASSFIENLRDSAQVLRAGVQVLPGLVGSVDIPRKTKSATFSFKAEGADTGDTDLTFDKVSLTMKSASGAVGWTRNMLIQGQPAIDAIVMRDLVRGIALLIDEAVLDGSGSANNPRGIRQVDGTATGAFTTANGLTWKQAIACETALATNNALRDDAAWFMTPAHRALLRSQPRSPIVSTGTDHAAAAPAKFVIDDDNMLLGYPVYAKTSALANNEAIFGVFNECLLGVWNMMEITRDTATGASSGTVYLRAWTDIDVAVKHKESFCDIAGS